MNPSAGRAFHPLRTMPIGSSASSMSKVNGRVRGGDLSRRPETCDAELLRLATTDGGGIDPELPDRPHVWSVPQLDAKTRALVRLGALVATGTRTPTYARHVADARAAGATDDEVLGVLGAVASVVGLAHLVAASVGVARGLGYDIDAAFERSSDDCVLGSV
jgi:alkylhydroperoxidase/carboxymuconolactone decarboxylase family protein YurZ